MKDEKENEDEKPTFKFYSPLEVINYEDEEEEK